MSSVTVPELAFNPNRRRFTRDEAARMAELGLIEGRYELIEGELISKIGQKPPHAYVIEKLTTAFQGRVRVQLPIRLPDPAGIRSEPEPDVVLLYQSGPEFLSRHPGPDDIALLIEVADTTLDMDRGPKRKLYASAGIAEYWIIDIQSKRTFVYRRPQSDEYHSLEIVNSSDALTVPASSPGVSLTLDNLLS